MSNHLHRGETHVKAWSGYWWPMKDEHDTINIYDDGGPLAKYDQYCVAAGMTNPHALEFERWLNWSDGRLEAATGQKTFWWGHCNGWAAAASLEPEPTAPRQVAGIRFGIGDQKGLLTVVHNADPNDIIRGLGLNDAHIFHQLLLQSIGREGRAIICDTKLDPIDPQTGQQTREVWNYPAYRYECSYNQIGAGTWDVTTQVWFANDAVHPDFVGTKNWPVDGQPKVYTYRITGNQENPATGVWIGTSVNDHPDIIWRPQPLSVQNALEEQVPGSSQSRFHPARRKVIYSIIAGEVYRPSEADRHADARLNLEWVVTPQEREAYPPPMNHGDFWRYSVSHLDSGGRWSKPFLASVEVVGWVGAGREDYVLEVGTVEEGGHMHVRHVVYMDAKTRVLSSRAPYNNGYAYTLHRDPKTGGYRRSEDPSLWDNSPLRLLISQMPYAWERAGHEPVKNQRVAALGERPVPVRVLKVGKGDQIWADHTVTSPKGNVRGFWLVARLDRISAQLVDLGHKDE